MIKKLIQNKAFSYSITSAALVMMVAILATKATGFIRQMLYSQRFYGKEGLDLFYAANLLPEVIFNIIALGSINAVLIPIMSKAISKEGNEKTSKIFSSIVNIGILTLSVVSILLIIFTSNVVSFAQDLKIIGKFSPADIDQLVTLMRLLLISPIILGISSVLSAVLQVKRHFLITQLSPLVYNLSGILALFTFVPFFGLYGLAYGVIFGSILHLLIQLPAFRTTNIRYYPRELELKNKYTRNAGKLMAPRLVGLGGEQFVLIVQTLVALVYPSGALSAFRNALTLRDIPISLFGVTLSQAAFPTLSESGAEDDMTSFKKYFIRTFQQIIFLTLPFAVFMMVLRLPIIRLSFTIIPGVITWDATKLMALILFFLTLSVLSLSLTSLLVRAFYSLSNTITPLIVSLIGVFIEVTLSIGFSNLFSHLPPDTGITNILVVFSQMNIGELLTTTNIHGEGAVAGIALATAVGSTVQVIILSFLLSKRIRVFQKNFFISTLKKFISSIFLGLASYVTMLISERIFPTDKTINVFIVLSLSSLIGFGIYILAEFLLNDEEFSLISKMYKKIKDVIMHNKRAINNIYKSFIISQEKK